MSTKSQLLSIFYLNYGGQMKLVLMHDKNIKTFTDISHHIKFKEKLLEVQNTILTNHMRQQQANNCK